MTDGAAPKPKTPARSMAAGCMIAAAIGIVVAALAGYGLWKVWKGVDEVAAVGAAWLGRQAGLSAEIGDVQRVERIPANMSVQIRNDEGDAWFSYRVAGTKASGEARVHLIRRQGEWRGSGARLMVSGRDVMIGTFTEQPPTP